MSEPESDQSVSAGTMIYHELHNVVYRYIQEAPEMSVYEIVGALEAVKGDVMDSLKNLHERD